MRCCWNKPTGEDNGKEGAKLTKDQKRLYDRQIGALGMETMSKLTQRTVLIVGMSGLGMEIAKNVILAGPQRVVIADKNKVKWEDLSAAFYFSEKDVGKSRAKCAVAKLAELNPYVEVSVHDGDVDDEIVRKYEVVVVTRGTLAERETINEAARTAKPPVAFISVEEHGLAGSIFCDFGPAPGHTVHDPDGERPRVGYVANISQADEVVITMLEDFPFAFQDGDYVELSEVKGMTQINGLKHKKGKPLKVSIVDKFNIKLDVSSKRFKKYESGGIVTQVKVPTKVPMRSLSEVMESPGDLYMTDPAKMDRPGQLHAVMRGIRAYEAKEGRLPPPRDEKAFNAVLSAAKKLNAKMENKLENIDAALLRTVVNMASVELSPIVSVLGGIAAQEVIKTCGKYMPINQLLYFDALECLPASGGTSSAGTSSTTTRQSARSGSESGSGSGSGEGGSGLANSLSFASNDKAMRRYSAQIAVFGEEFQKKLLSLRYFLVGAGALGCELLKGFAMMGVACGDGKITVTDMDRIEVSNLNRQFLFRSSDVGKPKSSAASRAIAKMNPTIKVDALETRVGEDTEDVFNAEFWESLSGVCNALDNIDARLYVDSQCVRYKKSLLESGTLGTKANTQVVIPRQTESYGSSRDPPEKETPSCTLHNFPYLIEHTIQLAREQFDGFFSRPFLEVSAFKSRSDYMENLRRANLNEQEATLKQILDVVDFASGDVTYEKCIEWARRRFDDLYRNQIGQLLYNFPADKEDENGVKFWSGTKRVPSMIEFDADDPVHLEFVESAARLRAANFKIKPKLKTRDVKSIAAKVDAGKFKPRKGAKIKANDEEDTEIDSDIDEGVIDKLAKELEKKIKKFDFSSVEATEFEKDDPDNGHIDFMTAAANLRARNYQIDEATSQRVKMIAGRIIPALATTTSMTTGLVCLELYKLVQERELSAFKNSFVNLALPLVTCSEPMPPAQHTSPGPEDEKYYPDGFTLWDRIDIDFERGNTLQDLIDHFQSEMDLGVSMISLEKEEKILYMSARPSDKKRLPQTIAEVYQTVVEDSLASGKTALQLTVTCDNSDNEEVDIPPVYLHLPASGSASGSKSGGSYERSVVTTVSRSGSGSGSGSGSAKASNKRSSDSASRKPAKSSSRKRSSRSGSGGAAKGKGKAARASGRASKGGKAPSRRGSDIGVSKKRAASRSARRSESGSGSGSGGGQSRSGSGS